MRDVARALLLALLGFSVFAQTPRPSPIFASALENIRSKVEIPVLLPSKLPFPEASIRLSIGNADKDGYAIELYYDRDPSNAAFAALFAGSRKLNEISDAEAVKLQSGVTARFRPVECGGSCAPANLRWVQGGMQYVIQLKLRSDMPVSEQRRRLVETANASVPMPRKYKEPTPAKVWALSESNYARSNFSWCSSGSLFTSTGRRSISSSSSRYLF